MTRWSSCAGCWRMTRRWSSNGRWGRCGGRPATQTRRASADRWSSRACSRGSTSLGWLPSARGRASRRWVLWAYSLPGCSSRSSQPLGRTWWRCRRGGWLRHDRGGRPGPRRLRVIVARARRDDRERLIAWQERHRAAGCSRAASRASVTRGARRTHVQLAQDSLDDALDRQLGEARGQAASYATAEGDPRVGGCGCAEEALGHEGAGVWIEVLAAVDQIRARRGGRAGGNCVAAELHRREQLAHDQRYYWAQAQRLLYDCFCVGVVLAVQYLLLRARELVGMAQQALERPGQRGRGGAVGEQRDQFVAQLRLAERRATPRVRALEHREDVLAVLCAGRRAAAADLCEDICFDWRHHGTKAGVV